MTALMPATEADPELAALVADHGTEWGIAHSLDCTGAPGPWHAVRHDPRPSLQGLGSDTAAGLRAAIECAEAMAR